MRDSRRSFLAVADAAAHALTLLGRAGRVAALVAGTLWLAPGATGAVATAAGPFDHAQRVACQVLIEDLKWSHRIWPEANPTAKPGRRAVYSDREIAQQVADNLRMEAVLQADYGITISDAMLQVELDRMASSTRAPQRLKELFDLLDNEPRAIAECVARPALVQARLRSSYQRDDRHHAATRLLAESVLRLHEPEKGPLAPAGAEDQRVVLLRVDGDQAEPLSAAPRAGAEAGAIRIDAESFRTAVARLQAGQVDAADGPRPELHETESAFVATRILHQTETRLELAQTVWPKRSFEAWWQERREDAAIMASRQAAVALELPAISGSSGGWLADSRAAIPADTWQSTGIAAPSPRALHTAVWTGSEMIVWGGQSWVSVVENLDTGGRYDPVTDTWRATSLRMAPEPRIAHTAVWTGTEMIVWGGDSGSGYLNDGARYDPVADGWTPLNSSGAPTARNGHSAIWTGGEMIIWGGYGWPEGPLDSGARYAPASDTWVPTGTAAITGRSGHAAIWSGSEMIIWGGVDSEGNFDPTGGRYHPGTGRWQVTSVTNAPEPRELHTAVWTGTEMIVWGGIDKEYQSFSSGGRYDPVTDGWQALSGVGVPGGRYRHSAVWTGSEMIVWGGFDSDGNFYGTGGRYDPALDSWIAVQVSPEPRCWHSAVWTGGEMIVWGGSGWSGFLGDGARYAPGSDNWSAIAIDGAPPGRTQHTAVWTGSEMIVWGGYQWDGYYTFLNNGFRYDPVTNRWSGMAAVPLDSEVPPRGLHAAVWTGTEMIVWGGSPGGGIPATATGGRYDPLGDTWAVTSMEGAPAGRAQHTAVWTGSEMIVWGGEYLDTSWHYLDSGGRYDPDSDSWLATTLSGAPVGRYEHTAVWSGGEMIVWGGTGQGGPFDSGGRYDPETDGWRTTAIDPAVGKRNGHSAVWTGTEMIVWGGNSGSGYLNDGARYDPVADAWESVRTAGAPARRSGHAAVWSGTDMIVWGGIYYDSIPHYLDSGGLYDPGSDNWIETTLTGAPEGRYRHTAVWTGAGMLVWGGEREVSEPLATGGSYHPYGTRELRVDVAGGGRVVSDPEGIACFDQCAADFWAYQTVALAALLDPSWTLGSWSWGGACSGLDDCEVLMDRNQDVSILFRCGLISLQPPPTPVVLPLGVLECANWEVLNGYVIGAGGSVTLQAEESIRLGAGFQVLRNGEFRALMVSP